jgi:hypothetical protein
MGTPATYDMTVVTWSSAGCCPPGLVLPSCRLLPAVCTAALWPAGMVLCYTASITSDWLKVCAPLLPLCLHPCPGDCCKWLGHSYLKLGDGGKAASAFAKGCELAEQCGNKRLQVGQHHTAGSARIPLAWRSAISIKGC